MVRCGLEDCELDRDDDEDWRLEDELQEEEELRESVEEMEENDDEELERNEEENYRLEDELQEEDEVPDVLEEMTPVDERPSKDTMPIDPQLEEMANHANGYLTVPHVLDQEFASMENEMAALRAEDVQPEDFELGWLW